MMENDANAANVEELSAHIQLAASRVKSLKAGTPQYEEGVADLEMYYERAVQVRKMRIETLEEVIHETNTRHVQVVRRWKWGMLLIASVSAVNVAVFAPEVLDAVAEAVAPVMTLDRVITNVLLLSAVIYGMVKADTPSTRN